MTLEHFVSLHFFLWLHRPSLCQLGKLCILTVHFFYRTGFPSIFVAFWAVFKAFTEDSLRQQELECSWMRESNLDWIIQAPAFIVLIINVVFLIRIMFVSNLLRPSAFHNFVFPFLSKIGGTNNKITISKYRRDAPVP